jgi:hypothetical protein
MDVKSIFLNGDLNEEVFGLQPPVFVAPRKDDKMLKHKKALYGLHQATKVPQARWLRLPSSTSRSQVRSPRGTNFGHR